MILDISIFLPSPVGMDLWNKNGPICSLLHSYSTEVRQKVPAHQNHQVVMMRTGVQENPGPDQDQREIRRIRSTGQDPSTLEATARRKALFASRSSLGMQRIRCYIDTPNTNLLSPGVTSFELPIGGCWLYFYWDDCQKVVGTSFHGVCQQNVW